MAETYRKKHIGLDGVILDWCSWKDGQWGQKTLDPERFPDAAVMNHTLHLQNIHSMISIWPNMDESCPDYQEMREQGCLLPASHLYDAFDRRARELYWEQTRRELYRSGFDAFWMDSSEGVTPEWGHSIKPEPWQMMQEFLMVAGAYMPEKLTNAYSFFHAGARRSDSSGMAAFSGPEIPARAGKRFGRRFCRYRASLCPDFPTGAWTSADSL